MRFVQQAAISPHRCAAIPFIGNSTSREGFIDLEQDAREGDHLYLSVEAVKQMARLIGFQPQFVARTFKAERDHEREKALELQTRITELESQLAAVQVLKGAGYTASRRPGRPKGSKTKAVA